MAIPTAEDLMLPLLIYAGDKNEYKLSIAYRDLARLLNITVEEIETIHSHQKGPMYDKLSTVQDELGKAGLIEPIRLGFYHITERGKQVLLENPDKIDMDYLKRFPPLETLSGETANRMLMRDLKKFFKEEGLNTTSVTDLNNLREIIIKVIRLQESGSEEKLEILMEQLSSQDVEDNNEIDDTLLETSEEIPQDTEITPSINDVIELHEISTKSNIPVETLTRWTHTIKRKKHAIFKGPPGTGKTFIAKQLAKHLISGGDGFAELVQFHPRYTYEDFIQGIRPVTNDDGTIVYPIVPGRFLTFCNEAKKRSGICVFIIDEFNRAKPESVFGELMYLLEYRDSEIPLASGGTFSIPENVYIIGTMNTADRSIVLVDHALMRRFGFIRLYPMYEILTACYRDSEFPIEKLITILKKLNEVIDNINYEIGISFFIQEDLGRVIEDVWCMEIEPYIEEYFIDQPGKVNEFRWDSIKQELFS